MSHIATTWAVSIRGITPGEFRVLIVLADCHNPARGCFPSGEYLKDACEMSNGALYNNLTRLEEKGHIRREARGDSRGGRGTTRYILGFEKGLSPENGEKVFSGQVETSGGLSPESGEVVSSPPEREPVREPVSKKETVVSFSAKDDADEAIDAYNAKAGPLGWAQCQKATKARLSKVRARLRDAGGLEGWYAALDRAAASPFLRGEKTDFRLGLDFLLQESSFTKLMEGFYDERTRKSSRADPDLESIARAARSR